MITDYVLIQLNGKPFNCLRGISLEDLLRYLNFEIGFVVIEYNHMIIRDGDWKSIYINSGDKIEVVTVVGGG
uniref:Thiamine biosynthesis protein S n=1 Tax=Neogoniolithon spectabile TaxID=231755 RepID=A0A3G3MGM6_9FLOR|nr:thiamine biosynthesis protein S [Neogoniolithon spectabile]AYR05985.1 thiamine biosynthesis protein S [Neogoniolithon spectabile]